MKGLDFMKKKILVVTSALAVASSGLLFSVSAQDAPTPEERAAMAVDTRKSLFKLLRFNLVPIAAMAQGAPFNAELVQRNASRIADMAPMIPDVFEADTREFDLTTTALDSIWDNQPDFASKAQALQENAAALAETAAGGDMAATLGAFRRMGGSCGNCHDTYRVDED
jgi:cytochrome c556